MEKQELARILRRDLRTVQKAVAYAERVASINGAYATEYAEVAEYLRTMYPTPSYLLVCPKHGPTEIPERNATCPTCAEEVE